MVALERKFGNTQIIQINHLFKIAEPFILSSSNALLKEIKYPFGPHKNILSRNGIGWKKIY